MKRLAALLPGPPARVIDAGCGPGLYAVDLAALGYDVLGVDVDGAVLSHARKLAAARPVRGRARFRRADLRELRPPPESFDAALLIYYVLENFPRRDQARDLNSAAIRS